MGLELGVTIVSVIGLLGVIWGIKAMARPVYVKYEKGRLPKRGYRLIYTDQKVKEKKPEVTYGKILVSQTYDITGKPDYVYQKRGRTVPVELKSGKIGEATAPREKDLMQLVMYFLILEDVYGKKPKQGRLIYPDGMFVVRNTKALRKRLKAVLAQMRTMLHTGVQEPKASFVNCRYCLCRETVCEHVE